MNPADIRDMNWEQLSERVSGLRADVHAYLLGLGPCTTRELAAKSGLDILTVRPRVTELVQLGFAEFTGAQDGEGIYRALSYTEAAARLSERQAIARGEGVQSELRL
jgi:DNA-binding MarR family transcriptional regulator